MYGDKGMVPEEEYYIPIGKADIKQVGKDVTLISFGKMMKVILPLLRNWLKMVLKLKSLT